MKIQLLKRLDGWAFDLLVQTSENPINNSKIHKKIQKILAMNHKSS